MRRTVRALCGAALVGILLASCPTAPALRERLAEIPEKNLAFYDFDSTVPLGDRITTAPASLVTLYARADGAGYGACTPTREQSVRIAAILEALPRRHREVLRQRLIGVYCVEGFLGSGMADYVLGPNDDVYAILLLNPAVFEMDASELLTRRAQSAFRPEPGMELAVSVSPSISGLHYIILHECTHIVDYVERHTPYVEPGILELFGSSTRDTTFTQDVWRSYREPRPTHKVPGSDRLRFYGLGGEPAFRMSDAVAMYRALAGSVFASLYATTSWAEDFAEYVTFYYLVHALGAEYSVRIRADDLVVLDLEPMASPLVRERARLLDRELLEIE